MRSIVAAVRVDRVPPLGEADYLAEETNRRDGPRAMAEVGLAVSAYLGPSGCLSGDDFVSGSQLGRPCVAGPHDCRAAAVEVFGGGAADD